MADSVNLNPFVQSSSVIDYKKYLEGKDTGEPKSYATSVTNDTEDEECGLLEGTAVENSDLASELNDCVNNLNQAFAIDADLTVSQQASNICNPDFDTDGEIGKLQSELTAAKSEYSSLLEKYKTEFLEQYTGDGKNIETEFMTFLLSKEDYRSLSEKYSQTSQYMNIDDYQKNYDNKTAELQVLKESGKDDKDTQAKISYLETELSNISNILDSLKKSMEYKKAAMGDSDISSLKNSYSELENYAEQLNNQYEDTASKTASSTSQVSFNQFANNWFIEAMNEQNTAEESEETTDLTDVKSVIEELLSQSDLDLLYSTDYKNTTQYQDIVDILSNLSATSNKDTAMSSIQDLLNELLEEAKKEDNKQ